MLYVDNRIRLFPAPFVCQKNYGEMRPHYVMRPSCQQSWITLEEKEKESVRKETEHSTLNC